MIICSCNRISDTDIRHAVDWMRAADPQTVITPGKVYRELGKSPDCGGCMSVFVASMRNCNSLGVPMQLRGLRAPTQEIRNERRQKDHRLSQPGTQA